jgi:hypothetical protein
MSLADFLSKTTGRFEVVPGFADAYPLVKVGGLTQPAVWLGDYALPGEPVIVGVIVKPDAPGQCLMLGRVGGPLPIEGIVTAAPAGSDTITVLADSVEYTVTFAADLTPTVGDRMRLLWQGGTGTAICKVGVTPTAVVAGPSTAPPPTAATAGVHTVIATDSGTFSAGFGWNSYFKQNVYQGNGATWGAPTSNSGAWFYGSGANQINGSTVTGIQFKLPARNSAGTTSASGTVHIYLHNSPSKPGGDVTRVQGPVDVVVAPNSPGGLITLPASWGQTLIDGGGIGITGSPYMGFRGRGEDPESGKLLLTWQR